MLFVVVHCLITKHSCSSDVAHDRWYRLFVPEAIPKAVRRSNEMLGQVLLEHDGPVAWGNTNSKPSDYKAVRSP